MCILLLFLTIFINLLWAVLYVGMFIQNLRLTIIHSFSYIGCIAQLSSYDPSLFPYSSIYNFPCNLLNCLHTNNWFQLLNLVFLILEASGLTNSLYVSIAIITLLLILVWCLSFLSYLLLHVKSFIQPVICFSNRYSYLFFPLSKASHQ